MPVYKFVMWAFDKFFALIEDVSTGERFLVPRSRLIPTLLCESEARANGINDPNRIVEYCAEKSSFFGIPVFRHYLHLKAKGNMLAVDEDELWKAYDLPPKVDFECIREKIMKGEDTDLAIEECSGW